MANRKSHTFEQLVSDGHITGHSFIHKFGAVPEMSIATTGTIWDINDTKYPWDAFDTAGTITVDRANAGDADKEVTIEGLDENWLLVTESIILTAAAGNAGTQIFKRVFRAYIDNGSAQNIGIVDIKRGGTIVARISAGLGQTLMMVYTIPAGKTGYMYSGSCTAEAGADGTGHFMIREGGHISYRVGHSFEVSGGAGYRYDFNFPIPIPEKTDVDVWLTTRANNGRYTAAFDLLLIDNDS